MTPSPLKVGIFAGGLSWPLYVALDNGFFKAHGLAVTLHAVPDSVAQMKGLLDGTFDLVMTPFDNVVAYREGQGGADLPQLPDFFAFMGGLSGCLRLLGGPGYDTVNDLRGTTIGVDAEHTGYTLAMYELLDRNGVPPGSYTLKRAGGTTYRVQALEEGLIAATMVSSPQEVEPEKKGFRRLADVLTELGEYQAVCGATRRAWAVTHAGELERFIAAYIDATRWLRDPVHSGDAAKVLIAHVDGVTTSSALEGVALMTHAEGFQPDAKFSIPGAETVLRLRERFGSPRAALQDCAAYVDDTFYQRAFSRLK